LDLQVEPLKQSISFFSLLFYYTILVPNPNFENTFVKKININMFLQIRLCQFMDEETSNGFLQGKCYGKFFEKKILWKVIVK